MAATVWKGYLVFGLVSIPVRMFRAARAERVKLRQLYRPARTAPILDFPEVAPAREPGTTPPSVVAPVQRVFQAETAQGVREPIERPELVKGYEYSKGEYVVLDDQELRALAPQTSTEMEIVSFVPFEEVDPIYLETSYYVAPDGIGAKPYALLFEAMRATGYAAIGHLTMHRRDHVMIMRTGKSGLIAHTMFYADEVRSAEEFHADVKQVRASELTLAKTLIKSLAGSFQPGEYRNKFRERLQEAIESKIEKREVAPMQEPTATPTADLMESLRRSLEKVGAKRKPINIANFSKRRTPPRRGQVRR